jgi:hypothetical protein
MTSNTNTNAPSAREINKGRLVAVIGDEVYIFN